MADLLTISLIFSTIRLATPLILAALGGLFSERSGVINIALEGMMLAGAFTAAAVTYATGNPWVGLVAAIAAGILVALIHAVACIRYKADQVVVGTAINIMMIGLPGFLSGALFLSSGSTPPLRIDQLIPRAPIVAAFVFVPITWYVLYRTPFGLRLRAVGENPAAADAAGIDVSRIRYSGVTVIGRPGGHRRCVPVDRAVVAVHAEHDVGTRFHRARGPHLRQVAPCTDIAGVPVFRLHRGDYHPDAGRC